MVTSNKQTTLLEERRAKVGERLRRGVRPWDIAKELGVSPSTITKDKTAIIAQYRRESVQDYGALVAETLMDLEEVKRAAWEGWEASRAVQETTRQDRRQRPKRPGKADPPPKEGDAPQMETEIVASVTKQQRPGDPAFLTTILQANRDKALLLGLDAPTRLTVTNESIAQQLADELGVSVEEVYQSAARYLDPPRLPAPRARVVGISSEPDPETETEEETD